MYWCRYRPIFQLVLSCGLLLAVCLPACKPDIKETGAKMKFFDIKGYFSKDSARLAGQNKLVLKSVMHNGAVQSKKVRIANWGLELSMFTQSDINRPAWRDSYTVSGGDGITIYNALDPELKTRKIMIKQDSTGKVKWIMIYNRNSPKYILYQTFEKLSYFPDSLYEIDKLQRVRILGTNKYRVKGFLN